MAEATPATSGPRYAPDDPTLPKPWKGLIDGNSGMLYYWNVETNVTQYEKPVGTPSSVSMPNMASIPGTHSVQQSGVPAQHGQQMMQTPQQQGQQVSHPSDQLGQVMTQQQSALFGQVTHHHASQIAQDGHLQSFQAAQSILHQVPNQQHGQHQGQQMPPQVSHQISQQLNQKMPQQLSQQMLQQSSHQLHQHTPPQQVLQQTGQQMPSQAFPLQQYGQGTLNHGMGQPQSYQFAHLHMQHMPYQQSSQQIQLNVQGQPSGNQPEFKSAFPKVEEVELQNGKNVGFSPNKYQHNSVPSALNNQNMTSGVNSSMMPHMNTHSGQAQQFSNSSGSIQQSPPSIQERHSSSDLIHQHGPMYQNQMGPSMMSGQPPKASPAGVMGYEENMNERAGSEYFYNSKKEGPMMGPQQSNVPPIPIVRNHQDMRMSGAPFPNVVPGHFSGGAGQPMHDMFNHLAGVPPPFPNNSVVRPPYMGPPSVTGLSPTEIYCQQHEVTATGDNVPAPFLTFEAAGFPPEILREIYAAGFTNPTPIQAQTWPVALQNRDIVAIAKTGSGKTLGYLMPAFMLLRQRHNNPQYGPTVLVLAPTRELATQIRDEAIKFGRSSRISITCLYGGAPKGPQLKELDRGADIVVATPGRLNDILESKKIDFRQVSLIVLDEADRMLDMGFEPQIRKIVNEIPPRRQTLMYTATWPKEVRKIASDLLVNPVQVNIGSVDELAANKAITQYVEVVPQMEKQRRLEQILRSQDRGSKVIIFCSTKKLCDQLARSIGRTFGAAAIHGDKSQGERDWVLNQFRSGKSPILVATDVAARGLDIKDIRIVINYDFPTGIEDYVHRIGRTGRAGAVGVAYTFFSEQDWKHATDLIKVLEGANQLVPPEIREMATRGPPSFGKDRMNRFDSSGGSGPGQWDSGGRGGMRDGGFGGRGGVRDGGFGSRGGMRDGGFGGRGGMRDGGFGGRGGMRSGGYGGRGDFFSGRGSRGRGLGGPGGGHGGWGRNERGPYDRYGTDGRGRGRGRGRFDNRRDIAQRSRGRSYSRSPERVRTWGYSRSRSRSRSSSRSWSRGHSRSRSRSFSRGRSRSYSRSISRSRSRSRSPTRSREWPCSHSPSHRRRSCSYDRNDRSDAQSAGQKDPAFLETEAPERGMSPMSPAVQDSTFLGNCNEHQPPPAAECAQPVRSDAMEDLAYRSSPGKAS